MQLVNINMSTFKLWSQVNPESLSDLKPTIQMRSWDKLNEQEKHIIWKHMEGYFFDKERQSEGDGWGNVTYHFQFSGGRSDQEKKQDRIIFSIAMINKKYKVKNFTPNFLEDGNEYTACLDFVEIFMHSQSNIVFELLSFYCKFMLEETKDEFPYKNEGESPEDYKKRTDELRFMGFDLFSKDLNENFIDFGIDTMLTRQGFVPRQDEIIMTNIVSPTLIALSGEKWDKVNEHFIAAFRLYKDHDYSSAITHSVSALQAFLQIQVTNNIGKGNISTLISEGAKKGVIPNDHFTLTIFQNIETILARERQEMGIAHPRLKNPKESNCRLILNLTMIFIQHSLQLK